MRVTRMRSRRARVLASAAVVAALAGGGVVAALPSTSSYAAGGSLGPFYDQSGCNNVAYPGSCWYGTQFNSTGWWMPSGEIAMGAYSDELSCENDAANDPQHFLPWTGGNCQQANGAAGNGWYYADHYSG
jgi:hypothetical protein